MAILHLNYTSLALYRTVAVDVVLPSDKITMGELSYQRGAAPYKTLYLLHGYLGSEHDWVEFTRIKRWAEEKNLAVVMPSGENAFYVDGILPNSRYGEFIGRELPQITRRMFPLSTRREDTFIAGLSMGGYGALRNGMKYADTFGYIAAFSSAVHLFEGDGSVPGANTGVSLFGDVEQARKTDVNPRVAWLELAERAKTDDSVKLPEIYMACGTEDTLLEANRSYRDFLRENGASLHYEEEPGGHEWDFWDRQIAKVLNWLPLDGGAEGLGSGNVR